LPPINQPVESLLVLGLLEGGLDWQLLKTTSDGRSTISGTQSLLWRC